MFEIFFFPGLVDVGHSCNFSYTVANEFAQITQGWMYGKNSILKQIFDRQMRDFMERGVGGRLLYKQEMDCNINDFNIVGLDFVMILFFILVIGLAVSLITLILERCKF